MQGNHCMNTISLACKGFQSRKKNGQIFEPKMFGLRLYLLKAAQSTNQSRLSTNQERLKGTSIWNVQETAKEKGGKEREKGEINAGSNHKKKYLHAHTFSHSDTCTMTFVNVKNLAVLDCEE